MCVEHIHVTIYRVSMTTWWRSPSPCETHRCVKNVAGESPWLRLGIYWCAEHSHGDHRVMITDHPVMITGCVKSVTREHF